MTVTETTNPVETLVYAGRRMSGSKAYSTYFVLTSTGNHKDGERRVFAKPLRTGLRVGQTLTVEDVGGRGSYRALEVGEQANDARIATWLAEDKAASVQVAQIAFERKLAREATDPVEEALLVLRAAMNGISTIPARAAFSRYVDEFIHNH